MPQPNCLYTTRYCWEAEKVKTLIRLRAELSPLFTGKRNASKYAWAVVERELNVPLPLSKIIKKWNNLLQEYKAIKLSEEPKRREWPFFNLMDVYFSDQVNDPTLRLFSSTKTLGSDTLDESITLKFEDDPVMSAAISAATSGNLMDISDMMQDTQSDKASEHNYEDMHPEVQMNNNYNNGGDKHTSPAHPTHGLSKSISGGGGGGGGGGGNGGNNGPGNNGGRGGGTPIGLVAPNDYDDTDDIKPPMAHTPVYMPQHHNIDQYLLSWNNFHGNMCKGFHNLQKDEKMVDVTIAAGGKIFKAHKLVLSVCSPYFQKIFLDHPSTHPILFMTDVNSNHMAGLLDFMYSGQVNVKYEDLPKFLKVAEIMQIKGLHTESTTESDESKYGRNSMKEPANYHNSKQHQQQHQQQQQQQQQQQPHINNINNSSSNNNNNNNSNNNLNIPSHPNHPPTRGPSFREHIRAKNPYQDLINNNNNNNSTSTNNNNLTNNNNNNNSSSNLNNNNNNNTNSTNHNLSPKYAIQQTNTSNKILDNQKYHKYFSKRKMMAQYELEMRNEKKNKLSLPAPAQLHHQQDDQPIALYAKSHLPPPQTEPEELTVNETNNNSATITNNNTISSTNNNNNNNNNNNCISSSDIAHIKVEPDLLPRSGGGVIASVAAAAGDDDDDSNSEYYLADLRKRKHSTSTIVEQTLALTTSNRGKEASTACS